MNLKKLITVMLVIVMLLLQFSFIEFNNFVYAEEATSPNSEKYHYKQLTQEAKKLYDAIYEMYVSGILKTGTRKL